jgi:hypothetical protein
LIYRPDFRDIEEQLPALTFRKPNGKMSVHFFDFRVTQVGGRRICVSVKPERIARTYEYQSLIACVKREAIGSICDDVKTITERNIDPITLHNAKLFHAARNAIPEMDARVVQELSQLEGPVSIDSFLAKTGIGGVGFFNVAKAIFEGHATLLSKERSLGKSIIHRGKAA